MPLGLLKARQQMEKGKESKELLTAAGAQTLDLTSTLQGASFHLVARGGTGGTGGAGGTGGTGGSEGPLGKIGHIKIGGGASIFAPDATLTELVSLPFCGSEGYCCFPYHVTISFTTVNWI